MPRPAGSKIIGGVFYYKHELDATGSPLVIKSAKGYSDTKIAPVAPEKPAQSVTDVSENVTPNNRIKAVSVHLYSPEQLDRIAEQTGQVLTGFFGEHDSAVQVPVFMHADQGEDNRQAKLTKIRRGI
jgi:hypothetical protein